MCSDAHSITLRTKLDYVPVQRDSMRKCITEIVMVKTKIQLHFDKKFQDKQSIRTHCLCV